MAKFSKLRKKKKRTPLDKARKRQIQTLFEQAVKCDGPAQRDEAEQILRTILSRDSRHLPAMQCLSRLLREKQKLKESLAILQKAIAIHPDTNVLHDDLAGVYLDLHQFEQSVIHCRRAIDFDSTDYLAYYTLGQALHGQRKFRQALEAFQKAMELNPGFVGPYCGANKSLAALEDKEGLLKNIARMKALFNKVGKHEQMHIAYNLGLEYDKLDQYEESFFYSQQANQLKMAPFEYHVERDIEYLQAIADYFSKDYVEHFAEKGISDKSPIFIVGMPRSGSSLVEQILASHPDVHGGGELPFLLERVSGVALDQLSPQKIVTLGKEYIDRVKSLSTAPRITDKLPANFIHIGIIKLAMPQAKIIHCRRNPLDTCLSCFRQNFSGSLYYANNLEHLGDYYRAYEKLMGHWHTVWANEIYDVVYEELIRDFEPQVRGLLDYCELPWVDACRDFYKSSRIVYTSSMDQIQKPIYDTSIERWQKYERYLGPLIEKLGK